MNLLIWSRQALLAGAAAALFTVPAAAVTLGSVDTFQGGSTHGWVSGAPNPNPPVNVASGGPAGAGDGYLMVTSLGGGGPGSRLVIFNQAQWQGDYIAAGVSAITMNLNNFGSTALEIHLLFSGSAGSATTSGVALAPGSGWQQVSFSLAAAALTGNAAALGDVTELRLYHGTSAPAPIAAQLGLDNVSAVPEPAAAWLCLAGLMGLAGSAKRRRELTDKVAATILKTTAAAATAASLPLAAQAGTLLPSITPGSISVVLQPIATGLSAPDYATFAPGDSSRLYVVEQNGLLRVIQNGVAQATPALNIVSLVSPPLNVSNANDERGFLGLAFSPDFNDPSRPGYQTLYTYNSQLIPGGGAPTYAAPNNATQNYMNVVNEWKMTTAGVVDPNSRREVLSFGKNAGNHNGGTILFGTDGYLYLGLGDGGNANDVGPSHLEPGGNAQNLSTPLGKMLRIDPTNPALTAGSADAASANGQYRIPGSNPFAAGGAVPEIYALGFRNPYRFSIDRPDLGGNGQIIVADVGQNNIEEIDRLQLGGNYGWPLKEGDFLFNRTTTAAGAAGTVGPRSPGAPAGLIDPIVGSLGTLEYDHGDGISITGGFVYRGSALPELFGKYIFGDLAFRTPPRADGRMFYADLGTGVINEFLLPQFAAGQLPDGLTIHGFGEDAFGEVYALVTNTNAAGSGGIVYKLVATAVPEPATWASLAAGLLMLAALAKRRR